MLKLLLFILFLLVERLQSKNFLQFSADKVSNTFSVSTCVSTCQVCSQKHLCEYCHKESKSWTDLGISFELNEQKACSFLENLLLSNVPFEDWILNGPNFVNVALVEENIFKHNLHQPDGVQFMTKWFLKNKAFDINESYIYRDYMEVGINKMRIIKIPWSMIPGIEFSVISEVRFRFSDDADWSKIIMKKSFMTIISPAVHKQVEIDPTMISGLGNTNKAKEFLACKVDLYQMINFRNSLKLTILFCGLQKR